MSAAKRARRAKFVPNIVKNEADTISPISLPPPPSLSEISPSTESAPKLTTDYISRDTIICWASKWQNRGFEFIELEEKPNNKAKVLAKFRCVACRENNDTTSPFFEGIISNATRNLRQTLFNHFEGDMAAAPRDRVPGCKSQSKFLQNGMDFDDEDESTCSEEEWAPPSIHVQRHIERADKHEELIFEEEQKHSEEYIPKAARTSSSSNKRKISVDIEQEKKRMKRTRSFKPESRHFIQATIFEALKRDFARQSFQFEVIQKKQENGVDLVCGKIWCQACAQLGARSRRKGRQKVEPEGIITTSTIKETLTNHCFPNPGQVKKLWTALKHQEALKEWVIRRRATECGSLPRANFISMTELKKLQDKFCKRGLKFDILQRRNDIDGTPLACLLVRCEACVWMQGHCSDFGHEDGVISTENISKLVKRHCKEKNVFHHQGWDHWRTIQKLKCAQHSEYTRKVRKHKRKQFTKQKPTKEAAPQPVQLQENKEVKTFSLRLTRNQLSKISHYLDDLATEFMDLTVQVKDNRTIVLQAPVKTLKVAQAKLRQML